MKRFSSVLALLEIQLIWFALLTPAIAVVAFMFGCSCSLWQWWAGAACAVAVTGFRRDRTEVLAAAGLMALSLGVLWILCGVLANPGGWDENAYHFPAVRLLERGWNPLCVRTPEAFKDAFGFVQGDMEVYHTLFQMKGVWIFNAVALKFTDEFFAPMMPLTIVMFFAVAIRAAKAAGGVGWRFLAVAVLYFLIPRSFYSLDAVLVLSAFGLLICMFEVLRGEGPDVPAIAGYTALMMAAKLNGIFQALIIWIVFGAFVLSRRLPVKRLLFAAVISAAAFAPLAVTPFLTGIRDYSHPLYPHCSSDPEHPVIDICSDFNWKRNADIKSLNHFEALVNAYVSPSLVRSVKKLTTGNGKFSPANQLFEHYPGLSPDGGVTALHWTVRFLFWVSVAFLCRFGGNGGAMVSIVCVLALIAVPTRMIGYVRYVPWMLAPLIIAPAVASRLKAVKARPFAFAAIAAAMVAVRPLSFQHQIFDTAWDINAGAAARELIEDGRLAVPEVLYPPQSQRWKAHLEIVRTRFPFLRPAEVSEKWGEDLLAVPGWLRVFPCGLFSYDIKEDVVGSISRFDSGPVETKGAKFRFVAKTFFKTVPKLVCRKIFQ